MFRNPLARDVAIALIVKTVVVIVAALFVFGPSQRPVVDAAAVQALFDSVPSQQAPSP